MNLNLFQEEYCNLIDSEKFYREAEIRAEKYFGELCELVYNGETYKVLSEDMNRWSLKHKSLLPFLNKIFDKKKNKLDCSSYINWLKRFNKLDKYLLRSISYIYMRDLGKFLGDCNTRTRIDKIVKDFKINLDKFSLNNSNESIFSNASLYKKAKEEHIEDTVIWLMEKIKKVSENLPEGLDSSNAKRKLIKLIVGVLMHSMEEIKDEISPSLKAKELEKAIRLGYSYGITYPFIDDILDSNVLNKKEKKQYSKIIRIALTTGTVPDYKMWKWKNNKLIMYILGELKEAFEYIKSFHKEENLIYFLSQAFIFYNSQEIDRLKDISNSKYSNEQIYIPIILKASSSRQIVKVFFENSNNKNFNKYVFYYGIYNQLADDFTDVFLDIKEGSVTPYTYYLKYYKIRPDLINPFELYWNVIFYLIHNVYKEDYMTKEVIFSRAFNSLKRFREKTGEKNYNKIMDIILPKNKDFVYTMNKILKNVCDVDFLDKLLRDNINVNLSNDDEIKNLFKDEMEAVSNELENYLKIEPKVFKNSFTDKISEAANYSLGSGGKHIRSLIAWMIGVKGYNLSKKHIMPILCSLEYMHTASLIFDDLPSQDNSDIRRGKPTLHNKYNVSVSELTGIFLIQKSVYMQTILNKFDSKDVLNMIEYTSNITTKMCKGQMIDLEVKGKELTLDELKTMCHYKTGFAFEAALIMPAIIAKANFEEVEILKSFAKYLGEVFQIRDDILDYEGIYNEIGKPARIDIKNNASTFVTILGLKEAKREMWDNYTLAVDELNKLNFNTQYLKLTLDYLISRNK